MPIRDEDMTPDDVWEALLGEGNGGPFFRSALALLSLVPPQAFADAVDRIGRETTLGPLLQPQNYLDGRRFDNARDYADVLRAAGHLRAVLERVAARPSPAGGGG